MTTSNTTVSEDVNNVDLFPHKGKVQEGLFPKNSSPKNENKSDEHLGRLSMDQTVEEINEESMSEDHTSPQTDRVLDIEVDHQRVVHKEKDTGMMLLIGDTGMIIMLTGETVVITIN